jgi:hypothetical protein
VVKGCRAIAEAKADNLIRCFLFAAAAFIAATPTRKQSAFGSNSDATRFQSPRARADRNSDLHPMFDNEIEWERV